MLVWNYCWIFCATRILDGSPCYKGKYFKNAYFKKLGFYMLQILEFHLTSENFKLFPCFRFFTYVQIDGCVPGFLLESVCFVQLEYQYSGPNNDHCLQTCYYCDRDLVRTLLEVISQTFKTSGLLFWTHFTIATNYNFQSKSVFKSGNEQKKLEQKPITRTSVV